MKVQITAIFRDGVEASRFLAEVAIVIRAVQPVSYRVKSSNVEKSYSRKKMGALKREVFRAMETKGEAYRSAREIADSLGYTVQRIKSTLIQGLNKGEVERQPVHGLFAYRLTREGLEKLERDHQHYAQRREE